VPRKYILLENKNYCREFRNILLGYKIIVHTDHKELTYAKSTSDRVMRWRLLIEEFGPELKYIQE
jgi:hypothetical protein